MMEKKIVLSPEEPDLFLAALKGKNLPSIRRPPLEIEQHKQSGKKFVHAQVLAVSLVYLAFLGYFFWVYFSLPQIVPVHFGFDGIAIRFADKSELLWLAGTAALFPAIKAVLTLKFGKYERGMVVLLGAIFVAVITVFVYSLNTIVAIA